MPLRSHCLFSPVCFLSSSWQMRRANREHGGLALATRRQLGSDTRGAASAGVTWAVDENQKLLASALRTSAEEALKVDRCEREEIRWGTCRQGCGRSRTGLPGGAGGGRDARGIHVNPVLSNTNSHTLYFIFHLSIQRMSPSPLSLSPSFCLHTGHRFIPYFPSRSGGKL